MTGLSTAAAHSTALRRRLEETVAVLGIVFLTGALLPMQSALLGSGDSGPDHLGRVTFPVLYGLAVLVLVLHWRKAIATAMGHYPLMLLLVVALLSATWSIAPVASMSAALGVTGTTAFGLLLAVVFSPRHWIGLVALSLGIVAFLSLVIVIVWPEYGIMTGLHEGAWRGAFGHKNLLGSTMAIGVVAAMFWRPSSRLGKYTARISAVLCFALLAMSLSRTAWVLLATAALVPLFTSVIRARLRILLPSALVGSLACIAVLYLLMISLDSLLTSVGRDLTLTGRTVVWASLYSAFMSRPLLGFGYDAIWNSNSLSGLIGTVQLGFTPSHAHNGWLEIAVGIGLIGVVLFGSSVTVTTLRALRAFRSRPTLDALFPLVFLFLLILLSLSESVLFREHSLYWAVYCAVALSLANGRNGQRVVHA